MKKHLLFHLPLSDIYNMVILIQKSKHNITTMEILKKDKMLWHYHLYSNKQKNFFDMLDLS